MIQMKSYWTFKKINSSNRPTTAVRQSVQYDLHKNIIF